VYTVKADVPHWQYISLGGPRCGNVRAPAFAPCTISCSVLTDPGGSCNAEIGQTHYMPIFPRASMLRQEKACHPLQPLTVAPGV
jgi:hypothetical protein